MVSTLKQALKKYQKDVVEDRCKIIDVDRAILWKTALMFYKSTPMEHLYRKLNVMFEGMEDAVDAGALSQEFFADLLRTINNNLFEGNANCRVPQYSWENAWQASWLHTHCYRMVLECHAWHVMFLNS